MLWERLWTFPCGIRESEEVVNGGACDEICLREDHLGERWEIGGKGITGLNLHPCIEGIEGITLIEELFLSSLVIS